jgi:hypothetical protein
MEANRLDDVRVEVMCVEKIVMQLFNFFLFQTVGEALHGALAEDPPSREELEEQLEERFRGLGVRSE